MNFYKTLKYGYKIGAAYRQAIPQRPQRFSYLDGIPQPIPRAQIIKRGIKHGGCGRLFNRVRFLNWLCSTASMG